jgi:hypothetical protein
LRLLYIKTERFLTAPFKRSLKKIVEWTTAPPMIFCRLVPISTVTYD